MPNKRSQEEVLDKATERGPEFRCIININTNIWEQQKRCRRHRSQSKHLKHGHKKICDKLKKSASLHKNTSIEDRIVPLCFRGLECNGGRSRTLGASRTAAIPKEKIKNSKSKKKHCKCKCRKRSKKHKTLKSSKVKKSERRTKKEKNNKSLDYSPISSISLSDSEISYDSISSDSMDSDYEIDRLIQRTKDLEKHTDLFELRPDTFAPHSPEKIFKSTSCDSLIMLSSETEVSIHSLSTVKLEPLTNSMYSPTQNCYNNEIETIDWVKDLKADPDKTVIHLKMDKKNIKIKQEQEEVEKKHIPIPSFPVKPEK